VPLSKQHNNHHENLLLKALNRLRTTFSQQLFLILPNLTYTSNEKSLYINIKVQDKLRVMLGNNWWKDASQALSMDTCL